MRVGLVIPVGRSAPAPDAPTRAAAAAEESGVDLAWLEGDGEPGSSAAQALTAASFLAAHTHGLRFAAHAPVGPHPIHLAEQASVADLASNGRLLLVLAQGQADAAVLSETVEVVLAAASPRPFTHLGRRWTVPGPIAVTPNPAQFELPIWLQGEAAPALGNQLALPHVVEIGHPAANTAGPWTRSEHVLGPAVRRLRRPAVCDLTCSPRGDFDDVRLVELLNAEAERWGLDVAIVRLPVTLEPTAIRTAVRRLAALVRPSLQMGTVPEDLKAYWQRRLRDVVDEGAI
jgi:hypothetical protein